MAMSLTVPCTASDPMSPPGKNRGLITKESVEKASLPPLSPPARGREVEHSAVVHHLQRGVVERLQEHALDQHLRETAATAVRHEHSRIIANWYWTGKGG